MPRFRSFVALAAGAAASLAAAGAYASALPTDWGVYTKTLIPLTGSAGSGDISVQVDWRAHKFCYALNTKGVTPSAVAVQKGRGGAQVVELKPRGRPGAQTWDGCAEVSQETAKAIIANPGEYYVSVNNGALGNSLGG